MDAANPAKQPVAVPPAAPPTPPAQSNNRLLIIIIAVVVGLSFLGWVGSKVAGFVARKALEAGTGLKIDDKGGVVSFKGQDGAEMKFDANGQGGTFAYKTETGETGVIETQVGGTDKLLALPESFPSDIPVMSGLKLINKYSLGSGEMNTFTLTWTAAESQKKIADYYKEAMPRNGWTLTTEFATPDSLMISFEKMFDAKTETKHSATFSFTSKEDGSLEVSLVAQIYK
jgi:hypothetical protein